MRVDYYINASSLARTLMARDPIRWNLIDKNVYIYTIINVRCAIAPSRFQVGEAIERPKNPGYCAHIYFCRCAKHNIRKCLYMDVCVCVIAMLQSIMYARNALAMLYRQIKFRSNSDGAQVTSLRTVQTPARTFFRLTAHERSNPKFNQTQ